MVAITYKNAGPWGAGVGRRLTSLEGDTNFYNLEQALAAVEALEPNEIVSITQTDNTFTIHMENGDTFGPFNLPVANIAFKGEWEADFDYIYGDLFTESNTLYFVQNDHTSSAPFNPAASIPAGPLYAAIMPFPSDFSFGFFFPGRPSLGIEAPDGCTFRYEFDRDVWLPAGLSGSGASLRVPPAVDIDYTILKNDTDEIGFLTLSAGLGTGTWEFLTDVQFTPTDVISFVLFTDDVDADARDMSVTVKGKLGLIPS